MQAAVVTQFGDPDVFTLSELPDPLPGPGQISINVSYAAVGLIDVYIRQGLYRDFPGLPQPPFVPGLEVAGTVRALGPGVRAFQVGQPVVTLSGTGADNGYASIAVVDAAMVADLSETEVDPAVAVAVVPNAATAYLALSRAAHLQPGERVLVHGALGGLASAFPGVARLLGAERVVGTVRGGVRPTALPYDRLVSSADLAAEVGNERFDVVVDPVGGQVRTDSLAVMAPMGRMLLVGNASGDWGHTVSTTGLWGSNLSLAGFAAGFYLPSHPEQVPLAVQAARRAIEQGLLDVRVEALPLARAAEAHRRLESGSVGGRIVLTP
ncbi:quinone oxidoreductase family protein [Actinoplanes sp. CA-030573]|uniref:quinone oxidoreductase family protein n=1 Tax=Actinoplanes sp. CA-030573 TaxID=3239898 RepID=UPI003D91CCBE